jgi:hypothetical protein
VREREKRVDLHDGEGIIGSGRLGDAEHRGVVNFGDGFCRGCRSPWGVLLKRRCCSSFSGHTIRLNRVIVLDVKGGDGCVLKYEGRYGSVEEEEVGR